MLQRTWLRWEATSRPVTWVKARWQPVLCLAGSVYRAGCWQKLAPLPRWAGPEGMHRASQQRFPCQLVLPLTELNARLSKLICIQTRHSMGKASSRQPAAGFLKRRKHCTYRKGRKIKKTTNLILFPILSCSRSLGKLFPPFEQLYHVHTYSWLEVSLGTGYTNPLR